jgi:hypothetical protein
LGESPTPFGGQRGVVHVVGDDSTHSLLCASEPTKWASLGLLQLVGSRAILFVFHGLLGVKAITIDGLQTRVCHSSVLPGTSGVAAMAWYTIGCVTLDSYQVRTPAMNTWRESRHWRDNVTNP